ncbi:MAG: hypothetical protein DMF77_16855 [Acidobacteria bacterium]|nr:MAG: hypothetical protein DMF77_16855 [Acidobacteriota bacterium]
MRVTPPLDAVALSLASAGTSLGSVPPVMRLPSPPPQPWSAAPIEPANAAAEAIWQAWAQN